MLKGAMAYAIQQRNSNHLEAVSRPAGDHHDQCRNGHRRGAVHHGRQCGGGAGALGAACHPGGPRHQHLSGAAVWRDGRHVSLRRRHLSVCLLGAGPPVRRAGRLGLHSLHGLRGQRRGAGVCLLPAHTAAGAGPAPALERHRAGLPGAGAVFAAGAARRPTGRPAAERISVLFLGGGPGVGAVHGARL